jgi:ribonuclease VapC
MFVDASALLAVLLQEAEEARILDMLQGASRAYTSPIALFETVSGLMSKKGLTRPIAKGRVDSLLAVTGIETLPITPEIGHLALDAFDKYGKGRGHPAQLNMGDCFAYACAKAHGLRLLYKGDDFSRTDIA